MGTTWAAVCLVGVWLPLKYLYVVLGVAGVGLTAVLCYRPWRRRRVLPTVGFTILAATACLLYTQVTRYQPVEAMMGQPVRLCVQVEREAEEPTLRVLSGELPVGTLVRLRGATAVTRKCGEVLEGCFELHPYEQPWLSAIQQKASDVRGVLIPTAATAVRTVEFRTPSFTARLAAWRTAMSAEIQRLLPRDVGAVVASVCLGTDEALSSAAYTAFRRCGVTHLFSVSGLHLSILTQALMVVWKTLRLPRGVRGWVQVAVIGGFVLLMGGTASVVRAGVMCALVAMGESVRRQADARNSLGLGLLLLLGNDAFAVYDVGLLLSFTATCGILFLVPPLQERLLRVPLPNVLKPIWTPLSAALAVTVAANVATLPVMVWFFGEVSVIGLLVNVMILLPAQVLLIGGWIAIPALCADAVVVYRPVLLLLGWLAEGLLWLAQQIAAVPFGVVTLSTTFERVWLLGSMVVLYGAYRLFRLPALLIAAGVSLGVLGIGMMIV